MSSHVGSPAMYRFENRLLFVVVPLYVLVVIAQISMSHFHLHPVRVWAVLCAVFMTSPVIGFMVCIGRYISEEKDEFQRTLLVQSILWGLGVSICMAVFWMVLGTYIQLPHTRFASDEFVFALVFLVSFWVNRWRYR